MTRRFPRRRVAVRATAAGVVVAWLAIPGMAAAQTDSLFYRDAVRHPARPDSTVLKDASVPPDSFFFRDPGPPPGSRALNSVRYMAPADAPYRAEEVRVRTPESIFLGGTFTVPRLPLIRTQGRRAVYPRSPAVVLISGAGADDRDHSAAGGAYRPFHEIADTLSRRGIAVLRLDDRGVGSSSGRLDSATTLDRANDARAAIAYLRHRADVDPKRIALLGLGEGAVIASILAGEDSALAGVILIACPAVSGKALARARVERWVDERAGYNRAERDSIVTDILADWSRRLPDDPWTRFYMAFDPIPAVRRVRQPAFILQGGADPIVPPAHADTLERVLEAAGNRNVTVRVFPNLGHAFVYGPLDFPGDPTVPPRSVLPGTSVKGSGSDHDQESGELPAGAHSLPREVLGVIANWLSARLRAA